MPASSLALDNHASFFTDYEHQTSESGGDSHLEDTLTAAVTKAMDEVNGGYDKGPC